MTTAVEGVAQAMPVSVKPRMEDVVDAVLAEGLAAGLGMDRANAEAFVYWMEDVVADIRRLDYPTHYLTRQELGQFHSILNAVIPDDTAPREGSAHEALGRFVLDPSKDEYGLRHSRTPDIEGEPSYCTVEVCISVLTTD